MRQIVHKLVVKLYRWMVRKRLLHLDAVRKLISGLQGGNLRQTEAAVEAYYVQMITMVILIMAVTILVSILAYASRFINTEAGIHVVRQDYGEDSSTLTVFYEDESDHIQEIDVEIPSVQYRPQELAQEFTEGFQYLEQLLPGDNTSLKNVQYDLRMEEEIPESGLTVTWTSGNYELLSDSGEIHNKDLQEPEAVLLRLELSYQDTTDSREYEIIIQPAQLSKEDEERESIKLALEAEIAEQSYEQEFDLPATWNGIQLQATKTGNNMWLLLLLLGVVFAGLFVFQRRNQLQEQMKQRKKRLSREYSYFINQIMLFTSAGATLKGTMERIVVQYEKLERTEEPLYQELVQLKNEIHTGVSQEQAYYHFGRRVGVLSYIKLSSLLTQQLRKGSGGIAEQLEQEEHDAFERRKESARKYGEEAGTKLLFPMILLMIVSMVLVMYPALASFAGGI